jgi:hypothetical protein
MQVEEVVDLIVVVLLLVQDHQEMVINSTRPKLGFLIWRI